MVWLIASSSQAWSCKIKNWPYKQCPSYFNVSKFSWLVIAGELVARNHPEISAPTNMVTTHLATAPTSLCHQMKAQAVYDSMGIAVVFWE